MLENRSSRAMGMGGGRGMEVEADGRRSLARTPGGDPARKDLEKLSMSHPTVVRRGRRVRPRFSFRRGAAARGANRESTGLALAETQ